MRETEQAAWEEDSPAAFDKTVTVDQPPPALPREIPAPGSVLNGRYTVLGRLGEGGMSVVLAAEDSQLDRCVALKLMRTRAVTEEEIRSELRLVREAQAMARLNHPHVVAVYDSGRLEDGSFFIAMECVMGQTLRQWCKERPHTWREVLRLFLAAGQGLAAAHAAGLVHRDFKPDNVLVGRDGRARVTDFGLARPSAPAAESMCSTNPRLTLAGCVVGTPRYLAPELLRGGQADTRSDVFSFCMSLYEALCEQPVFVGDSDLERTHSRMEGRIVPPPAHLPTWVMRPVLQGLSPRPDERPTSMAVLLEALSEESQVRRRERRLQALGATAVLGLVALAAGGWLRHRAPEPNCAQMEQELTGIWDEPVRRRVLGALEGTRVPSASLTADRVIATLEEYSGTWLRQRARTCEQGLALVQAPCLDRRRDQLRALTERLGRGPDVALLSHALEATRSLPSLRECEGAAADGNSGS